MLDPTFSMQLPLVCRMHHSKSQNHQTNLTKLSNRACSKILSVQEFKAINN